MCGGPALALARVDERSVLRASVFSIVLVLAIGQDTSLLCRVWCHPGGAATAECQEQMGYVANPSVTGDDSCGPVVAGDPIFVREDLRGGSDQAARSTLAVPRYRVPAALCEMHHGTEAGRLSPLESRPLVLALRI
jgi:hypothetical protein